MSGFQKLVQNRNAPPLLIAAASILVHTPNLLNYPAWFFDEGAYIAFSKQWASTGQLTYFLHPFGAFVILAVLFVAFNPTGYLIPRILMMLFSAVDGVLLYQVAKKWYSRSASFPLVASTVYVAAPLSARYLRLVVVDNFMSLFLLLSLLLLLALPKYRLFSALSFGYAVLSKQTAVFFLPAFLFLFWRKKWPYSRMIVWVLFAAILPAVWVLWALYGTYPISFSSLVNSQAGLRNLTGERAVNAVTLIIQRITSRDPSIFLGLAGGLWGIYKRDSIVAFPIAYLGSFVVLFLKISTVYLIPALPFFALVGTQLLYDLVDKIPRLPKPPMVKNIVFAAIVTALIVSSVFIVVTQSPAVAQQDAINYLVGPRVRLCCQSQPGVIVSYTYSWLFQQNYPGITIYDRYSVPWNQLLNKTVYMIVDYPGDLITINSIPQYQRIYQSSKMVWNETLYGYTVQVLYGTVTVQVLNGTA